jgi:hypothetical protein
MCPFSRDPDAANGNCGAAVVISQETGGPFEAADSPMSREKPSSLITRHATIERGSIDEKSRRVPVSFSSEIGVLVGGAPQILLHEKSAVDLEPLRTSGSVLMNHDPDRAIGRPEDVRLDTKARVARATAVLDDDEEALGIFKKIQSGTIRGVSVRARVNEWQILNAGESWTSPEGRTFKGPADIASSWSVREFSFTPIPEDASVGVGRSFMKDDVDDSAGTTATVNKDDEIRRAERERQAEIRSLCDMHEVTRGLADELCREDVSIEVARGRILEALRAAWPTITHVQRVDVGVDERDKFRRDATDSLLMRCGLVTDRKRESEVTHFSSLVEVARHCVGGRTRGMRPDAIVQRALSHSESDFPQLLENVANKALLQGWEETPATWEPLVRVVSSKDFKPRSVVKLGDAGNLEETDDLVPMPEGSIPDTKESYSLATYAKRFGIGRKAIINDDLGALSEVPRLMGNAARRKIADVFYNLLVSASGVGPTMAEDAKALFATDHTSGANYTASTGAPDVAGLNVGRKLMRRQKGYASTASEAPILNIMPSFLLVPAALETTAMETLSSIWKPGAANETANVFSRAFQLVVEPRLDDATNGATAWYLVASPATTAGAEIAFLNGRREPSLIRVEGSNALGVEWGIYLDFAAKLVEHRGWYRCRGA